MTPQRWSEVRDLLHDLLEQDPQERARTLERVGAEDPELRREAETLLACQEEADQVLDRTISSATGLALGAKSAPVNLGVYRLVRQLGQGGMGVVWLGERDDGQFTKRVAIKLLPPLYVSTSLEARFVRERQILAQMEHPNIARLLDGGVTQEGQPYLVMEYIDGVALTEWADEQRLDLDARVRVFLDVCAAVSYAHRNLIVHRDLKPGNILVDREGQVKLLDFGLARILEQAAPDLGVTQTAMPMMTPAYASPEQVQGRPSSAASDVFSLGVILYELLSGKRPFGEAGQTVGQVMRAVCETELAAPSRIPTDRRTAKRLEGDLDNIILKALEKDPDRRYDSVDRLAQDLRWHQQGRPVSARKAGWRYRAGKFARRNRMAVGVVAAALIAVVAGAAVALREGQRAQRRFNDVRRLAHAVIFDLHDAIAQVPGSTKARELLVRQGLEYLDTLSGESGGDVSLQRELADGYLRLGTVQGQPGVANLGDRARAQTNVDRAVTLLEAASKAEPGNRDIALRLSAAYQSAASLRETSDDLDGAREMLRRALTIGEADVAAHPGDSKALRSRANTEFYLASVERHAEKNEEAVVLFRKVLTRYEALLAMDSEDHSAEHDIALVRKRIGGTLIHLGRNEEALREYPTALEIDHRLAALSPGDMDAQLNPTYGMNDFALALENVGRREEALEQYQKALQIRRRLVQIDQANARLQSSLDSSLGKVASAEAAVGDGLAAQGRKATALRHWEVAHNLYVEKGKRTKLDAWEETRLAHVRTALGDRPPSR